MTTDAWLQTERETPPFPLVQSRKRVVRLQLLQRRGLRATERNVRRKKVSFQLERIIKKQKLLEAQKRLEQLKALCWFQDDRPQKPPHQVPSPDAGILGPQCRSKSTRCSSLSLQRLCLQYLPQLHRYSRRCDLEALAEITALLPRQCSLLPDASVSSVCAMGRCVYPSSLSPFPSPDSLLCSWYLLRLRLFPSPAEEQLLLPWC